MKYRIHLLAAIAAFSVLLLAVSVVILTGPFTIPDNTNPSPADSVDVENKVDQLLQEIIDNGPVASSNPHDYLKDSKAFVELVALSMFHLTGDAGRVSDDQASWNDHSSHADIKDLNSSLVSC